MSAVEAFGYLGIWCGLLALGVGVWAGGIELVRWRNRRRATREALRLGPRLPDDGAWAPEWGQDWPRP